MKFSTIMHFNPVTTHTLKTWFLKNQDGRRSMPEHVRGRYTQSDSATHSASADGVHIGATWRIRLKRPFEAAMRPFIKLLWPLVFFFKHFLRHLSMSSDTMETLPGWTEQFWYRQWRHVNLLLYLLHFHSPISATKPKTRQRIIHRRHNYCVTKLLCEFVLARL